MLLKSTASTWTARSHHDLLTLSSPAKLSTELMSPERQPLKWSYPRRPSSQTSPCKTSPYLWCEGGNSEGWGEGSSFFSGGAEQKAQGVCALEGPTQNVLWGKVVGSQIERRCPGPGRGCLLHSVGDKRAQWWCFSCSSLPKTLQGGGLCYGGGSWHPPGQGGILSPACAPGATKCSVPLVSFPSAFLPILINFYGNQTGPSMVKYTQE